MRNINRYILKALAAIILSAGIAVSGFCSVTAYADSAAVAEVTWNGATTAYFTMDEAWNKAVYAAVNNKPATIKLLADWYPSRPYTLRSSEDFTIDLNGYKIDRRMHGKMDDDGNVFTVRGTLTIVDSRPDSTGYSKQIRGGVITGGAGDGVGGCIVLDSGVLNMTGGSIVGCCTNYHGGAVYIGEGSHANISSTGFYSNMTFDSTDSCYGGAIYADEHSKLNIRDSVFENNYSEDSGGAIYDNDGTVCITGTLFNGNKCLDDGGAIYLESEPFSSLDRGMDATLDGCIFENNRSEGNGGALYCNSDNVTMILGCTFRYNSSAKNGGAIFVNGDNVCLIDSTVASNSTSGMGGGVFVDSMYDINLQGFDRVTSNKRSSGTVDNLFISEGSFSSAHIFNGGLAEGSIIGVGTRNPDKYTAIELTSEYQTRYFVSDMSNMQLTFNVMDSEAQTEYLIASALDSGEPLLVPAVLAAALAAVAAVIAVIVKKGKREGKKDER